MHKSVKTCELFDCGVSYLKELFASSSYPWEMLPKIKAYIRYLMENGIEGFTEIKEGVLVGKNVTIAKTATVNAPLILGHNCEIRPGAYLRGNVITGSNCVLGNSSEFKNCILLDKAQAPHYNYIGDSVLGNRAHLGAGSICSNLKTDGSDVVIHADVEYQTGLRKIGGILADDADVGCGCILNPGTVLGKKTSVYPLNALRGVFPAGCIVKTNETVVKRIV